jgi:hypothetical protein
MQTNSILITSADEDLDLHLRIFLENLDWTTRPTSWFEKNLVSVALEFLSCPKERELGWKKLKTPKEMHRSSGFRNAACGLKGNGKLVERLSLRK